MGDFIYVGKAGEKINPTAKIKFPEDFKKIEPLLTGEIGFKKPA